MNGNFFIGLGIGVITGGLIVAKNNKISKMIKDSEQAMMEQVKSFSKSQAKDSKSGQGGCECEFGEDCGCNSQNERKFDSCECDPCECDPCEYQNEQN